jgi:hypothetical protein
MLVTNQYKFQVVFSLWRNAATAFSLIRDACFDMFLTYGIPPDRSKVIHGFDHLSDHRPVRHWVVLER